MTSGNQWREEKRRQRTLTPLNEATSAAYDRCNGAHVRSDQYVMRDHGGWLVSLRLCARCGVPITSANAWMNAMAAARRGRTPRDRR